MFSLFQWLGSLYTLSAVAYVLAIVEAESNPIKDWHPVEEE